METPFKKQWKSHRKIESWIEKLPFVCGLTTRGLRWLNIGLTTPIAGLCATLGIFTNGSITSDVDGNCPLSDCVSSEDFSFVSASAQSWDLLNCCWLNSSVTNSFFDLSKVPSNAIFEAEMPLTARIGFDS